MRYIFLFTFVLTICQQSMAGLGCQAYCLNTKDASDKEMFFNVLSVELIAELQHTKSIESLYTDFSKLLKECQQMYTVESSSEEEKTAILAIISPYSGKLVGATAATACYTF